jgi:hypothetical protein
MQGFMNSPRWLGNPKDTVEKGIRMFNFEQMEDEIQNHTKQFVGQRMVWMVVFDSGELEAKIVNVNGRPTFRGELQFRKNVRDCFYFLL